MGVLGFLGLGGFWGLELRGSGFRGLGDFGFNFWAPAFFTVQVRVAVADFARTLNSNPTPSLNP